MSRPVLVFVFSGWKKEKKNKVLVGFLCRVMTAVLKDTGISLDLHDF